tara:strand:- start:1109 stop:1876 length:768 start_codon:yes stop_codon:yes gene_type:complete
MMSIIGKNISYHVKKSLILNNISLEIKTGEILTIIGPNGAGKSTLINILSGDIQPSEGLVKYNGKNINNIKIEERALIRSVMSESQKIAFNFTVKDIIEMGWIRSMKKQDSNYLFILNKVVEECGIKNLLFRNFNSLSTGEKRRIHLARTLIQLEGNNNKNLYLILDEPSSNLDLYYEKYIMKIIRKRAKNGFGIVMVLHNINLAYQYSDKILLLKEGNIVAKGATKKILNNDILTETYKIPIFIKENNIIVKYI